MLKKSFLMKFRIRSAYIYECDEKHSKLWWEEVKRMNKKRSRIKVKWNVYTTRVSNIVNCK